jgi:hypothetical protein
MRAQKQSAKNKNITKNINELFVGTNIYYIFRLPNIILLVIYLKV